MDNKTPLYNSRIIKVYLEYLEQSYPDIDKDELLSYAGMTNYEINDLAHWFNQDQVDRFNEFVTKKTKNYNISREAGRHAAFSRSIGPARQYTLGLLGPGAVYMLISKVYRTMSKASDVSAKKLKPNVVEIIAKPKEGVSEKPYQCENRTGMFEAVGRLFSETYSRVEHPECLHRGDEHCKYIVSWDAQDHVKWKKTRNIVGLIGLLASIISIFIFPINISIYLLMVFIVLFGFFHTGAYRLENRYLTEMISSQGNAAKEHLEELKTRSNNALFAQEIGQAVSAVLEPDALCDQALLIIENRLNFNKGLILLAGQEEENLKLHGSFGFDDEELEIIKRQLWPLKTSKNASMYTSCFSKKDSILLPGNRQYDKNYKNPYDSFFGWDGHDLVCLPLTYKKEVMGILVVGSRGGNSSLNQSDVQLLTGVSSELAVSMANARAFRQLKQSESKYRNILDNIKEGYFEVDLAGNMKFCNGALCDILGYGYDEILGMNNRDYSSSEESERVYEAFHGIYSSGEPGMIEGFEIIRKDGERRLLDLSISRIEGDKGESIGFRGIARDVTSRKIAEQEKKELEKRFRQAQKLESIGTLAGGIAHDFNNLLMGILGRTSLMLSDGDTPLYCKEQLRGIEEYVKSASDLTKQLLGFARSGKYVVQPVNINGLIKKCANMFGRTKKDVLIHESYAPDLRAVEIDKGQFEQLFMNLFVNAGQAMPGGGDLYLETGNVHVDEKSAAADGIEPGQYVAVSVADNGMGMDERTRERIFDPFFTTKTMGHGTGLGLASVYGIIKNHNGNIKVESEKGKGSKFVIQLPASVEKIVSNKKENDSYARGNETILLVDDEDMIIDIGEKLFLSLGYSVMTAKNGKQAVELYKDKKDEISLVVLDMVMPEMSGSDTFDRLKEIDPRVKVLLSSGYSLDGEAEEILKRGCKGFIQKPFSMKDLSNKVREILGS